MVKKFLVLLCALLCACCISAAAEGISSGDFTYIRLSDGTVEITAYNGSDTSVTVPAVLDGLNVTSIGDCAFFFNSDLKRVELPDGITAIKWMAFAGCSSLQRVTLPPSVAEIDPSAFSGCSELTIDVQEGSYAEAFCQQQQINYQLLPNYIVSFGRYEQDGDSSNGKEDIEWIVLAIQDQKALLISRSYGLDN